MGKSSFAALALAAFAGIAPIPFASLPALALQPAPSARLVPTSADPDWVEVRGDENVRAYVDRRSIRTGDGRVRYVGRIVYARATEDGVLQLVHSGEIDCARNEYRIVAFDALGAGGGLIASHRMPTDRPAERINAGSPNESLAREYCARG